MRIKKMLAAVLGLAAVCAMAIIPVVAASPMNANEKAIYDKWFNGVVVEGKTFAPFDNVQGVVTNYFIRDDVEVTAEQKDQIIAFIDKAYEVKDTAETKALAKAGDVIDLSKLPYNQRKQLLSNAQYAGQVIGLDVIYNAETNSIEIRDAQGVLVCDQEVLVKKTGETSTASLYIAVASLIAVLGAAVVVAGKKVNA